MMDNMNSKKFWALIEELFHQKGLYDKKEANKWEKTEMTLELKSVL